MKYLILFILGIIVGFLFGVLIYWLPLKQFKNELLALWNLCSKSFNRADRIKIKIGTRLKPVSPNIQEKEASNPDHEWVIWNDEGVSWHFTSNGWQRARVLQITNPDEVGNPLYKICHLDLIKS